MVSRECCKLCWEAGCDGSVCWGQMARSMFGWVAQSGSGLADDEEVRPSWPGYIRACCVHV